MNHPRILTTFTIGEHDVARAFKIPTPDVKPFMIEPVVLQKLASIHLLRSQGPDDNWSRVLRVDLRAFTSLMMSPPGSIEPYKITIAGEEWIDFGFAKDVAGGHLLIFPSDYPEIPIWILPKQFSELHRILGIIDSANHSYTDLLHWNLKRNWE